MGSIFPTGFLLKIETVKAKIQGLYAIADYSVAGGQLLDKTRQILEAGINLLQFRAKSLGDRSKKALAQELLHLCNQHDVALIINDDVDLAAAISAQGVHLGRHDPTIAYARNRLGEQAIIGVSCYADPNKVLRAKEADYVAFGRFFPSGTKPHARQADLSILGEARKLTDLPLVAIGGITVQNAGVLLESGADALAVAGGLYIGDNPGSRVEEFQCCFAKERKPLRE